MKIVNLMLSASTQLSLKSILLGCIQRKNAKSISKKLCDTVSELASSILLENGWPNLLSFIFQCVTFDSTKLQEAVFLIFAQLAQYIEETLVSHIKHPYSDVFAESDVVVELQCENRGLERCN